MNKCSLLLLLTFLIIACSESKQGLISRETIKQDSSSVTNTDLSEVEELETEDGPPFKVDCPCSFADLGSVRISQERLDVLVSGKDWDPKLISCNWVWGELVNNEGYPDTLITDLRIHLLDLSKINQKLNKEFFDSKAFKENLIATHSKLPDEEYMTTKFDPYKTGKYANPTE